MHTTKKLWTAVVAVLLLVGWGVIDVAPAAERQVQEPKHDGRPGGDEINPQHLIFENLGSANATDIYRLACTSSSSRCAEADVADEGPFFDTNFRVTVVCPGVAPVNRTSGVGGLSSLARACRAFNGPFTCYVIINEVNLAGAEDYSTFQNCDNANGFSVSHTVTKIVDQ